LFFCQSKTLHCTYDAHVILYPTTTTLHHAALPPHPADQHKPFLHNLLSTFTVYAHIADTTITCAIL
jgi:hypothetical protein